jgi:hypothetical protein
VILSSDSKCWASEVDQTTLFCTIWFDLLEVVSGFNDLNANRNAIRRVFVISARGDLRLGWNAARVLCRVSGWSIPHARIFGTDEFRGKDNGSRHYQAGDALYEELHQGGTLAGECDARRTSGRPSPSSRSPPMESRGAVNKVDVRAVKEREFQHLRLVQRGYAAFRTESGKAKSSRPTGGSTCVQSADGNTVS